MSVFHNRIQSTFSIFLSRPDRGRLARGQPGGEGLDGRRYVHFDFLLALSFIRHLNGHLFSYRELLRVGFFAENRWRDLIMIVFKTRFGIRNPRCTCDS